MDSRRWSQGISTCRVPWATDTDWEFIAYSVSEGLKRVNKDQAYFSEFFDHSVASMVYHSNRLEQTLNPQVQEGETYIMIQSFMKGDRDSPAFRHWDAEGGRDQTCASSDRQLYQYLQGARFLCETHLQDDLTIDLICECHKIIMSGSVSYGIPTSSDLRDKLATTGMYVFVAPQHIHKALLGMIKSYNKARDAGVHPIELSTQLFYDCITIHPFVNGNGRLCRLLLSWSLMRDGFPFYVSFSTGHKKRRQHYLHAIHSARVPVVGSRRELNCILLQSCQRTLGNYLENARVAGLNA